MDVLELNLQPNIEDSDANDEGATLSYCWEIWEVGVFIVYPSFYLNRK